jgi:D-xylose transport system substrate-binding protein
VGFSLGSKAADRWHWDRELLAARCEELGARLSVRESDQNPELQLQQAHELLDDAVDVLIVMPGQPAQLGPIVSAARQRGVPVVFYDRPIPDARGDLLVTFDNVRVGELQAQSVHAIRPVGRYVIIGGADTDPNASQIRRGQLGFLSGAIERGDILIVADEGTDAWSAGAARALMERAMSAGPGVDAVVASNDVLAGAAIEVLARHGLAGTVPVSGQDGDLAACRRIVAGTQTATVYKPFWLLAKRAAEAAVALARGEPIEQQTRLVPNGRAQMPAVLLEPYLVDQDNLVTTIIKDGYHSLEEVYAEVPREQWPKP